jgi:hypothetical protein
MSKPIYTPGKIRVVIAGSLHELPHDYPCCPAQRHDHGYIIQNRQAYPLIDHDFAPDTRGSPQDAIDLIAAVGREVWVAKPGETHAHRGRVESAAEVLARADAQLAIYEARIDGMMDRQRGSTS